MFALPISMPRFESNIFYQNSPKIKLFLQKMADFSCAKFSCLWRLRGYAFERYISSLFEHYSVLDLAYFVADKNCSRDDKSSWLNEVAGSITSQICGCLIATL